MSEPPAVLVADDEPLLSDLLERLLQRDGYAVVHAADGDAALACANDRPDLALAIVDLTLPPDGGPALLERLRALDPQMGLIVTGGGLLDRDSGERLATLGARFVPKPFAPRDLLAAVSVLLEARD